MADPKYSQARHQKIREDFEKPRFFLILICLIFPKSPPEFVYENLKLLIFSFVKNLGLGFVKVKLCIMFYIIRK